jgi:FkbH-like protein
MATPVIDTSATDELLTLHRAGRLAAEYPRIRGLLDGRDDNAVLRAGRLLAGVDQEDVLRAHPGVPVARVVVTGHGTLTELTPALTGQLARHGVLLRPTVTDYNTYVVQLADPDSELYRAEADVVLCLLDAGVVVDELPTPWDVSHVEQTLDEKLQLIEQLAATFHRVGRGTLVLNTMPLPRSLLGQLVDHRSRALLGALWREFTARLLRLAADASDVIVIDTDSLAAEGIPVTDERMDVYAGARLSTPLLARYAREVGHLVRGQLGLTRKCLVVDLDQTLWGGVLGDDGVEGIEVAGSYRGEAFRRFQLLVKQIGSQGVLLAVASKNDLDRVREALDGHPEMALRAEDFVRICANWRPKPDNLRELAEDLNIAPDSLVFVDDSPFECGLVRHELGEVSVVQLDEEPALHPAKLLADDWFAVRELTTDDRVRPARYRTELARKDFQRDSASVEDYLARLDIEVRFTEATDAEIARVSQLSLRTNQFNMTTVRLQPAQVRALADAERSRVLVIHTRDRFGDNGLVGAVFTTREGDDVRIDNFLLSCRVFARGIEQACLAAVLRHAAETGARGVVGSYRPTAKNRNVAEFYARNGFAVVGLDGDTTMFRHGLLELPAVPGHITLVESQPGGQP